ncbi:hypothetical protein A2422_04535 [Candidatus Woesebacteria bacterium RIFOXYC1_FULL_31_51]|uniref:DedA n=1 Tax=Candidatus Woesebacteria bacterium GW2011_GWC2_31_9 TaxID=1618586 RepID=A0A0F9YZZ5_9BACT|nr:MAG: DedA [Candidatus Woesebacteria bacterium GW2011_GWF1_31_35]KKP23232.1 MAG: DedA [Candidatus Woesebacteria bacterium GW2011_GWC1_30_29]KKP25516.1 MAG: DedA [Candidatus Woesebacteria bacterium GW2011_GWD1_31_12]KKP27494.1 MAG: DedA [Candidatus Woesebacteria bacterium GW2011_GWB1_31_29]KKP31986.1 MAG: DedA [Candidatus Woesebacteria bacterium GW2011_GWC2_31_9]KKP33861.1 MAG: DedA [Candidatus Woesebacteria bacterium GW2011_GWF2_32_16]KKP62552.1 MAG: DedA [Candidatus Woesebacteria bacterium
MELVNLLNIISVIFEKWGILIIFFGSLIEITPFGWAVPGGVILAVAGFLSNNNQNLSIIPIIMTGTFGAWIALMLAYIFGLKSGMWLVKKLHQENNARFAKSLLQKNGGVILTTSMLANLTRFWISYIAGVEKYSFLKFNIYAFLASLGWVSVMTLLGFFAGYEKENLINITKSIGIITWILLLIAIFVIYKAIKKEYKHFKKDLPHDEIVK